MGKDSVSSAQLKCMGGGEMTRFGLSWGEPGQMGGEQGVGGIRGVFTGEGDVVSNAGGVYYASGGEMAHLRGFWEELSS
jgi:hypothetical protein